MVELPFPSWSNDDLSSSSGSTGTPEVTGDPLLPRVMVESPYSKYKPVEIVVRSYPPSYGVMWDTPTLRSIGNPKETVLIHTPPSLPPL